MGAVQVMLVCPVNIGSWRKGRRTAEYSELPAHNARGTLMHLSNGPQYITIF